MSIYLLYNTSSEIKKITQSCCKLSFVCSISGLKLPTRYDSQQHSKKGNLIKGPFKINKLEKSMHSSILTCYIYKIISISWITARFQCVNLVLLVCFPGLKFLVSENDSASLASWVERETIYLWLWSFCAGGRRFVPQPWHYSRGSFSSSQATSKVFSTEHAIYSKFI